MDFNTIKLIKKMLVETKELILENRFATVEYLTDAQAVQITWKGFTPSQQLHETMEAAMEAVTQKDAKRLISDMSDAGAVAKKDQQWIIGEVFPQILANGVEKVGLVVANNVFSKFFGEEIKTCFGAKNVNLFEKSEQAEKWINN
jgi:hypothetical protein